MAGTLEDHNAIRELASNYAAAASQKDVRGMTAAFTADGCMKGLMTIVGGEGDLVGAEAIAGFFGKIFERLEHVTQMPHTANIVVSGDLATSTCDIVEYAKYPDVPGFTLVVGHYDDKLRRTAAGWRFAERALAFRIFQHVAEAPRG